MATPDVRTAVQGDADAIARVWVAAWQVAYRGLVPDAMLDTLSVAARAERWRERLRDGDPEGCTTVAQLDGELVGYCRLAVPSRDSDAGDRTAEVASLYVTPQHTRTGIGGALLSGALEALRIDGWHEATLWVFAANEAARGFYSRRGFAPDGTAGSDDGTGLAEVRLRARITDGKPAHDEAP